MSKEIFRLSGFIRSLGNTLRATSREVLGRKVISRQTVEQKRSSESQNLFCILVTISIIGRSKDCCIYYKPSP